MGEGRDCLADSLSNDGIDNDDGSFVARAGDAADGGHLLLLAGWRINLIAVPDGPTGQCAIMPVARR